MKRTGWVVLALWGLLTLPGCSSDEAEAEKKASGEPPVVAIQPRETQAKLELQLKAGDRFPMLKTVAQTLTQPTREGTLKSHSHLELLLELKVEDVKADGMKLFSVRYHRVRYSHDIPGQKLNYNSDDPEIDELPVELRAYKGMVGNGFAFWLGADNRIVLTDGFRQFLNDCVAEVPDEQRALMIARMSEAAGNDGIANFVDDSIGLLPYSTGGNNPTIQLNQTWGRNRQVVGDVPMLLVDQYQLKDLTETLAEVEITGQIERLDAVKPQTDPSGIQVTLIQGKSMGSCSIDRRTGLPQRSQVLRILDMAVELPNNGPRFIQNKQITSTIRTFAASEAEAIRIGQGVPAAAKQ